MKFDLRTLAAIGLFGLSAYVLTLLAMSPTLATNTLFGVLAQAIVISGLIGGVSAFLFGSSEGASKAREQVGKAIDALTAAPTAPEPPESPSNEP